MLAAVKIGWLTGKEAGSASVALKVKVDPSIIGGLVVKS